MKHYSSLAITILMLAACGTDRLHAQRTAFTYQGRLNNGTNPATGSYDLTFTLFNVSSGAGQVGNPLTNSGVSVSNGLFTVTLDFGNQFPGAARWLEIGVRTNNVGTFQTLIPRQPLTPAPYAIYAGSANATNLVGTVQSVNLSGVALLTGGNAFTGQQTVTGGSVGIGTTSPAKQLDVTGSASGVASGSSIDPSLFVRINNTSIDGNTSSPDYAGIGFGHNSTRQAIVGGTFGNDSLDFYTGGSLTSPKMRIDFGGNVGIGTTTPATTLQVAGTVGIGTTVSSSAELSIAQPGGLTQFELLKPSSTIGYQFATDSGGLGICEHNIACGRFYLQNGTGNVGIGTALPANRLDVQGSADFMGNVGIGTTNPFASIGYPGGWNGLHTAAASGNGLNIIEGLTSARLHLRADNNATNVAQDFIIANSANQVAFQWLGAGLANGPLAMSILSNGKVGFGTASPDGRLGVSGGDIGADEGGQNNGGTSFGLRFGGAGSTEFIGSKRTVGGNRFGLDFYSGGTARISIANNGNVGIATTSPTTEKLVVAGGVDLTAPATTANNDSGLGLSFESYGGRIQSFQNKPLVLNPIANSVGIGTTNPATMLEVAGEITTTAVNITSDRNAKEQFTPVNVREVLAKVAALPISEWQYKTQADARHIGPMAQDFREAFALGHDEKHIATVDEGGVALAAIQGLNEKLDEKDARIQQLEQSVAELKQLVTKLASQQKGAGQ